MVRRFSKPRRKRSKSKRSPRKSRRSRPRKELPSGGGCSISTSDVRQWKIKHDDVTDLYKYFYDTIEHGGKFELDTHSKKSSKVVKSNSGQSDSVDAPDAIVNWHTHPVSCYLGEKTVWGWPSGEDMRETVIFGLRGSACHIVPTVEGVYLMQPNPCVISSLINIESQAPRSKWSKIADMVPEKEWGNFLRGLIILAIEIYFRSTHVFRTIEYIENYPRTKAKDFVDFTNAFKLQNMFKKSNVQGCSVNLKCNQIQQFEDMRVEQMSFKKYVQEYENDTKVWYISESGAGRSSRVSLVDILDKGALNLLKKLSLGSDCNFPIKKWHSGRMFLMRFYPNKVKFGNQWVNYNSLHWKKQWEFLNTVKKGEIDLIEKPMKFYLFNMSGKCDYSHLKQHISHFSIGKKNQFGKTDTIEMVGSKKCKFCREAVDRAKANNIRVKVHYFGEIAEAIQEASQKAGHQVDHIPAYFKNGKYSNKPLF